MVNLGLIEKFIEAGKLDAASEITEDALVASGLVRRKLDGVRVLAKGDVTSRLNLSVTGASKAAVEAVEKSRWQPQDHGGGLRRNNPMTPKKGRHDGCGRPAGRPKSNWTCIAPPDPFRPCGAPFIKRGGMASAAEQMAANMSWRAFGKATELRQRIWFTLGLLIIYRIGTYIPVPGIDGVELRAFFDQAAAGLGGVLNMFTGGALSRMGVFALGIMPYISASIIVQLMAAMVPAMEQLKKEGEQGRKKLNQYTRYGTVALATAQAYGLAVSMESGGLVTDPRLVFPPRPASSRWSVARCS